MLETFIIFLTGHLLGDFIFQTNWMVGRKKRPEIAAVHTAAVTAITALCFGLVDSWSLLILLVTHFAIDFIKTWTSKGGLLAFGVDQAAHVAVLVLLSGMFDTLAREGIWYRLLADGGWKEYLWCLTALVSGPILAVSVGGVIIGKATEKMLGEAEKEELRGLDNGGRYIGMLERALIYLMMLAGLSSGIGFLFAAKSLLRFGDIKEAKTWALTEYIIIGTFMSFGWGLLVAVVVGKVVVGL